MAYLLEIAKPDCQICGKRATHTLYNRASAKCGDYCDRHAKSELIRFNKSEADYDNERAVAKVHES
jgi:hypothetical protein